MHTYLSELQIQSEMLTLHLVKSILGQLKKKRTNFLKYGYLQQGKRWNITKEKKNKLTKRSTSIHG